MTSTRAIMASFSLTRLNARVAAALLCMAGCFGEQPEWDAPGSCEHCTVVVEEYWTSHPGDPNVILPESLVEVGDSVIIVDNSTKRLVVFGPDGRTVRAVGRKGDGPAEFRGNLLSLHRFSDGSFALLGERRITYLSPQLEFVRSVIPTALPRGRGARVGDASLAFPALLESERGRRFQHLVNSGDGALSSYDSVTVPLAGAFMSPGARGTVWVMLEPVPFLPARYRVERWDPVTGELLHTLSLDDPPWFTAFEPRDDDGTHDHSREHDRAPIVYAVYEDSANVLWMLTAVSDRQRSRRARAFNPGDLVDSVLEAIDLTSNTRITSVVFDDFVVGFTNQGRLVRYREDRIGRPELSALSFSLHGY